MTDCPKCGEELELKVWQTEATCPHCATELELDWDYVGDYDPAIMSIKEKPPINAISTTAGSK